MVSVARELTLSMLLLARRLPGLKAGSVADSLDDVAPAYGSVQCPMPLTVSNSLGRVVLAGGLRWVGHDVRKGGCGCWL